jgi:hypothetical protein
MVINLGNATPYSTGTTGRPLPTHDPTAPTPRREQIRKPTVVLAEDNANVRELAQVGTLGSATRGVGPEVRS